MKLDPILLLAPEPPTRRGVLWLGAACVATGFAGGLGAARLFGSGRAAPRDDAVDSQVGWARELAAGPPEDLYRHTTGFLVQLNRAPDDPVLWRGVERLAAHIVANPDLQKRPLYARNVADYLRRLGRARAVELESLIRSLDAIAGR